MLHKYVFQRGKRYYFRWRIPSDLRELFGVTEFIQTLHTSSEMQATVRARRYIEFVVIIKTTRESFLTAEIEKAQYEITIRNYWLKLCVMARKNKLITTEYLTYLDIKIDYGSPEKDAEALKLAIDLGIVPKPSAGHDLLVETEKSASMLFSVLFEEFITHKVDSRIASRERRKPLSAKAVKEYRRYYETIIEIMSDLPIKSIDKKAVKGVLLTYRQLPKRNISPYKGLAVSELLEMDIPDEHLVSNKTVDAVRKVLQGIFRYAIDSDYISDSPARDLNMKLSSRSTFANFEVEEVRQMILMASDEKKDWQRWMPLLAAYTGARRTELVQLRKKDVKIDPDSGRHYILITDAAGSVKTENSIRQVPLHKELLEAGFIEFVEKAKDRVFDDLKPETVTSWFTKFRDKLNIERFNDFGDRKVFHSFRHSFITLSRNAGNTLEAVQQVVGHEKSNAGTTDRYSHRIPVKDILVVVDKVKYN